MKKLILPSMLVISLMATAQFSNLNSNPIVENLSTNSVTELMIEQLPSHLAGEEEQEVHMDFNVTDYLPESFDVYQGMISDESYLLTTEEIPFDFNTEEFLPNIFDVYEGMITEIEIAEEEISFSFDIESYLPLGFNANQKIDEGSL